MSRMLDMLRGERWSGEVRTPADRELTTDTAVVLRALSGSRERQPWYRTRLFTGGAILGVVAIVAVAWHSGLLPVRLPFGHRASPPAIESRAVAQPASPSLPTTSAGSRSATHRKALHGARTSPASAGATARRNRRGRPAMAAAPELENVAPASEAADSKPGSGASKETASREDEHFKRARYYQQTGEFEKAVVEYTQVLQRDEMNFEAHHNLGLLYKDKGLQDEAIKEFRKAIAIDPRNVRAHNNLGVAYLGSNDFDAAAAEFRWLLSVDARNVDAMVNLALALRGANRGEEAREILFKALQVNARHPEAHYNLAVLYEDAAEIAKAIEQYEAYLKYAKTDQAKRLTEVREHCQALRQRIGPGF